jgi:predicted dehydrogenase
MRGYPQEFEDFVDAIRDGRPPRSGATPARDVVDVIYAGYLSAATGRRVS